jgi:hypothetical protein
LANRVEQVTGTAQGMLLDVKLKVDAKQLGDFYYWTSRGSIENSTILLCAIIARTLVAASALPARVQLK